MAGHGTLGTTEVLHIVVPTTLMSELNNVLGRVQQASPFEPINRSDLVRRALAIVLRMKLLEPNHGAESTQ